MKLANTYRFSKTGFFSDYTLEADFENPVIEPNGAGVKIDGWTHYSPSTTLSVEPHNGSDWLKVVSTNGTHGAHQAFAVEPGESYTFEIDLHRPAGMNKEINIVIWKNTGPSGALSIHVLNTDGFNTFNYTATSSNIYIQIRQAGTYYLDNIKMYRTYQDTVFVGGFDVDMAYRYGFNTQERVPEIQKDHYTAPYWEYDPRVVHRWNRDPKPHPSISPYAINQGNPIWFSDPLGDTIKVYSNTLNDDGSRYYLFSLDDGNKEVTESSYDKFKSSGNQWYAENLDNYTPLLWMNPNLVEDGKAIGVTAPEFAKKTNEVRKDLHASTSYKYFGWGKLSIFNNFNHGEQGDIKAKGNLLDGYHLTVYTSSDGQTSLIRSDLLGNFLFGFMAEEHGQSFETSRGQGDFLQSGGVDDMLDTYFLFLGHEQRKSGNTVPRTFNTDAKLPD